MPTIVMRVDVTSPGLKFVVKIEAEAGVHDVGDATLNGRLVA